MEAQELKKGDVVQISPELEGCFFRGAFMLVTEPKAWGAQGFVAMPKSRDEMPGQAYFRCRWADMEFVGTASWVPADKATPGESTGALRDR